MDAKGLQRPRDDSAIREHAAPGISLNEITGPERNKNEGDDNASKFWFENFGDEERDRNCKESIDHGHSHRNSDGANGDGAVDALREQSVEVSEREGMDRVTGE